MISAHPDIACLVARIEPDIVTWRRHLHAQPELSFKEFETSRFVAERLRSFGGIEVSLVSETGVMGRLRGTSTGPTVALRADIDALPIQEENTFDFVSRAEGVMHGCGHDGHTAVLLGVARILADMRDEIPGEIRFLFQHAEELPPGGARDFIAAGVMDGVDYVIGCHLLSTIESGQAAVTVGPAMAAADMFSLTIRGKGGHGGFPHETTDPIAITSQVITNLQHIVARQTDPLQSVVVSTTRIAGELRTTSSRGSVRPRRYGPDVLGHHAREHPRCARAGDRGGNRRPRGDGFFRLPRRLRRRRQRRRGRSRRRRRDPRRTRYRRACGCTPDHGRRRLLGLPPAHPGAYFFVGTRSETAGSTFPHHHPRFTLDEGSLRTAVGVFLRSVATLLHRAPLEGE